MTKRPIETDGNSSGNCLPPSLRDALNHCNPVAASGMERLIEITISDGALSGSTKLLFLSSIAAVKLKPELTNELLVSALSRGLEPQEVTGAAGTLLVSRGMPPCAMLLEGLLQCIDLEPPTGQVDADQVDADRLLTSPDEALRYAESTYGLVPAHIELMASELPGALEGFHLLRSGGLRRSGLNPKLTELLLVAVNAALMEVEFVERHAREARREGASETELAEAALTAVPLAGLAAWRRGAEGIVGSRS
jgi:alkylhydroperoxidase/carboxymuconolactone decarboxylase family protein YurZ